MKVSGSSLPLAIWHSESGSLNLFLFSQYRL
nr:MAG TPA: hypothetical protein [Caudoviricetes sp.]